MHYFTKSLIVFFVTGSVASAQTGPQTDLRQQVQSALVLEQQGQFDQVIAITQPLVNSTALNSHDLVGTLTVLGVAYEAIGQFSEAQRAYDRALGLVEHDPQDTVTYAAVLENYARLYAETSDFPAAERLWLKALDLRRHNEDHAAAARSLNELAGLALARSNLRQARSYVKSASEEMKLARDLTPRDIAVLSEIRGWLALSEGHAGDAIVEYQRALEICRRLHGDQHWLVGWEHMVLGRAYAQSGDARQALDNMRQGLSILASSLGTSTPEYFISQMAYAQVLDQSGAHTDALRLRSAAEQASKEFYGRQCVGCTISKNALLLGVR